MPHHLYNLCNGIGDTVSGLYVACGLANATAQPVTYHTPHAEWFDGIAHPNVTITTDAPEGVDMVGGRDGYERHIASAESRVGHYCETVANALGIEPFTPARPQTIAPHTPQGHIVLAPFATSRAREWPAPQWAALANLLTDQGHTVHAITSPDQGERLADRFKATTATLHADLTPRDTIALILNASLVVANDSGMAHVAGLYDVPTLAIHAGGLPHAFLFDMASSITSLTPTHEVPRDESNVEAMYGFTVSSVSASIAHVLGKTFKGYT